MGKLVKVGTRVRILKGIGDYTKYQGKIGVSIDKNDQDDTPISVRMDDDTEICPYGPGCCDPECELIDQDIEDYQIF